MSNLGAVMQYLDPYSYGMRKAQIIKPQQVLPLDAAKLWWLDLFSSNLKYFTKQFANKKPGWWKSILQNSKLSPQQKFEKIFGVKISQVAKSEQLLGDLFSWIDDFFSKKNMKDAEQYLRQGEKVAGDIANMLSVLRKKKYNVQEEMKLQDIKSDIIAKGSDIWDKYGIFLFGGAAILIFMLAKK